MSLPHLTNPFRERRRSVAFIENDSGSWACFLVTFPDESGTWHGFFSFRPGDGEGRADDIRTADIFIEEFEEDIHEKARGLGRPLLAGLLESALYTQRRREAGPGPLRGRFRALLAESSAEISEHAPRAFSGASAGEDPGHLRSLYASYRLDQVAHFICLVEPDDFEHAVDVILEGRTIDFLGMDRMQFSMLVVDYIERSLPLPDFDTWAADYRAHPDTYRLYAHTLHREGRLP